MSDSFLDENKYNINGFMAAFLCTIALAVGFGIGSYMHDSSETRVTLIFVLFGLLIAIGKARTEWLKYQSIYMDMVAEHRMAEQALLEAQLQVSDDLAKEHSKSQPRHAFTSDDFAADAQGLLMKPVKQARKAGARVTGEGLISTILKGIK